MEIVIVSIINARNLRVRFELFSVSLKYWYLPVRPHGITSLNDTVLLLKIVTNSMKQSWS
jgi:hypothetical protein